jgi:CelD/BcsL family acetyltransferase involved in cellulose biosynthesis
MAVSVIDPLADGRWDDLVEHHPLASVFHSRGWLEALKRTYGYQTLALTTDAGARLENGLVFCRIKGWRSSRLVSLPFSDHCEPLIDGAENLAAMVEYLRSEVEEGRCRSFELRPRSDIVAEGVARVLGPAWSIAGLQRDAVAKASVPATYCLHTLDLCRPVDEIFSSFHPSHAQRAIRRAEREGLSYEAGRSDRLLSDFYRLLRLARRRHGLPPQPLAWFRNLLDCLGERLTIHVARRDDAAIAAILTLSFKKTMVYKYGGSDARYHAFGAMPFVFWRAIQDAKERGIEELDLGRSDLDQPGLIAFKDHLGAVRSTLTYCTYPAVRARSSRNRLTSRAARSVISHLPDGALDLTGRLLYRYFG